ncbi:hypothetical protein ACLB2K_043520 [Fragaria x ananassa]
MFLITRTQSCADRHDVFGSRTIGVVRISAKKLCSGIEVEEAFPILETTSGKSCMPGAVLSLSMQYTSIEKLAFHNRAVGSDPDHQGVPGTYFPLKERRNCWQDIYDAIRDARHLIYIAGWSLYPEVRLLRNIDGPSDTLGYLLKTKSEEKPRVKVVLLVWDDPTSNRFKREARLIYTHHQKTVIVDADAGDSKRKIIAFVGGLDLCLGRYDTPEHPIYRTLQTVHLDDYHNPTFSKGIVDCPREPWHDLHCKIEGPAAYDILTNFEQRWGKTPKPGTRGDDDALLKIENIPAFIKMAEVSCLSEDDKEAWDVQVCLKSISHCPMFVLDFICVVTGIR